jgi:hypothetical protein
LEHGALLDLWVVLLPTSTELALKVLVVFVSSRRLFTSNVSFLPRLRVWSQIARCVRILQPGGSTIANKITFREELNEIVFSMTADAAAVAHSGRGKLLMD